MEKFIEIKHLEKIYSNGAKAVYDFNLDIERNEFIVIVGPSGCGKSTTLRMVAGLEDISSGELYIGGELANYKPSKDRKVAIVFQSYALYPQMNVFENIAFPLSVNKYSLPVVNLNLEAYRGLLSVLSENDSVKLVSELLKASDKTQTGLPKDDYLRKKFNLSPKAVSDFAALGLEKKHDDVKVVIETKKEELKKAIEEELKKIEYEGKRVNELSQYIDESGEVIKEFRKLSKEEIEEKVFDAARILDLGPYLNRLPKQLSGGQMQRVALGRAIVKDVPVFLMDEPLSNLDAKLRLTMRSEIVKLHEKINATTLYVTHDQTEAMTMADRIVVMSKGFIQQIGVPSEIYGNPTNLFVAKFIGSPTINVMNAIIEGKQIVIGKQKLPLEKGLADKIGEFYDKKSAEFNDVASKYDENMEEGIKFIRKVISANAGKDENMVKLEKKKKGFGAWLASLKNKKSAAIVDDDKEALLNKCKLLDLAKENAKELSLAIRPENITLTSKKPTKGSSFEIVVSVSELLGKEYFVHFDFEGNDLVATLPSKQRVKKGDKLYLSFDEEGMLYFDPITGERIA